MIVVFFSCKKEVEKSIVPETKKIKIDSLIYSSSDFAPHLKFNSELTEYELIGLVKPKDFTTKELSFTVKENDYNFEKSAEFEYYTATTFDVEKTNYKVIAYTTYGENDIKVLNIQLNSYQGGKQIDALLLDCRFTFEIEYYRNFSIKNNGIIAIKKLAIDGLLHNDEGDIIGKRAVKDTITEVVQYKMDATGHFIKS